MHDEPAPVDLALGSFSDRAPWTVELDSLAWRPLVAERRAAIRAELPSLVRPRRVPPIGRIGRVLGRAVVALAPWQLGARRRGGSLSRADLSRRLRRAAEALGPTYIKLGQIISSGEGLFPEELVEEFKRCRDQVPPETFADVRAVVEADLGRPLESVFASFERRPLAAASIAQVHAATLCDGTEVVVKVQRPTVARLVREDLRAMAWLAPHLIGRIPVAALANPPALVELFGETITEELDFRLEADNMVDIARSFAALGQRGYVIPRPHPELVTERVLVMERLSGFAFDDVAGMRGAGVDTRAVVRTGMIGFLEGCMLHGIFHGDLHGGNLFVLPDGRTALLDFGITGRLDDHRRIAFLRLLVAASTNDLHGQLAAIRDLGALPHDTDLDQVISDLGLDRPGVDPTTMTPEELTSEIQRIIKALLAYGARMPKVLMLFVKNMVFLDGAIATLAPDLDLFAEIAHVSLYFAQTHGERIAAEVGRPLDESQLDLGGFKAMYGVDQSTEQLTYRELQQRRELIRDRLQSHGRPARRRARHRRAPWGGGTG
ncbi:MAG: AarF/ABC1/UbiB kinase family protein [Actinobacteria bacterium]|nr:AarF/ABC1/UbiB kinase family protein [Actinomycetota bacterium]